MDHHTSWFSFLPGYQWLHHYLQAHYSDYVLINGQGMAPPGGEYETVHHIFAAALVILLLMIMAVVARIRISDLEKAIVPSPKFGLVNFFELVLETILGLMKDFIGPEYKRYVPLVGTLALFILVSNLLGLVPGFVPPTDNLNTTFACGLVVFVYFNFQGLRKQGIAHITHLLNPIGATWGWILSPLLGPIELIGLCVRPVSLAVRLMANMLGGHKVLFAFAGIFPLLLPLPFYILGFLVCVIQTAVFTLLSISYIAMHTAEAEH
jgi:F-type H+-transporting ATPase subunit a